MDNSTAKKICELVNRRNRLPNKLREYDILSNNYFYINAEIEGKKKLVACGRAKLMSFFCYEIKHVSVHEDFEGKGFGKLIINIVEEYIRQRKIPVAMATTLASNEPIIHVFEKLGYSRTKEFVNEGTSNPLILWSKFL